MHSSAAPASSADARGTPNTAELSTTRNGRSRLPPPSEEYRIASISRFGRAISSGNSTSDNSCPSNASVSSAVWSSRLAKSAAAVAGVIKAGSGSKLGRTIGHDAGFVNYTGPATVNRAGCRIALKSSRYEGLIRSSSTVRAAPSTDSQPLAHRSHPVSVRAVAGAAALARDTFLSGWSSGLDADGVALAHRRGGIAAMGRSRRDVALAATRGGRVRGREILYPSRHRLGRVARRDRRCGGWRAGARRLDHHPAGREKPVSLARPQRDPQGAGGSARHVDRPGAAETTHPRNLSEYRRARPWRPVWRTGWFPLCLWPSSFE